MRSPKRARRTLHPQSVAIPSERARRGPSSTNCLRRSLTCPPSRQVTIEKLSDEVLLNIFRHYLDASPRVWPRLVHICRKWRRIVFASQRPLHLRLFCTHRTPVLKTLDYWPALPIVVEYGGSPVHDAPAPEDEDNILAALKRSERVSSIHLTVTNSLLENLSTISEPFSKLEELVLLSRDNVQLTLPSAFRWGPRLRRLHFTGIGFPAPLQQLSYSRYLVDIQLHNIIGVAYTSPEALANALSGMTQLQSLSLHLLSSTSHPEHFGILPSYTGGERVVFPTLTHLNFRGTSGFFDRFVVRIDSPLLGHIEITFDQPTFFVSKLCEFIDRIEMQKSHRRSDILFSERSVSISLTQSAPTCLKLQLSCESLSLQLYSIAQICSRFSAFLLGVERLSITVLQPSSGKDDIDREGWLKLIYAFRGTKWVHLAGDHSANIVLALNQSEGRRETVLPALHKLCIREPEPRYAPLQEAVVSFMQSRRLSGHFIGVEYERLWINKFRRTGPVSWPAMIEVLSDDVLWNIFLRYLDASQQLWPTLTHVCQRWRQIVFSSPLGLDLRLYCTYGTPVLKTLDCWPPLPIVMEYGGSPAHDAPAPEDEDNILAALKRSDRVRSIHLTVTKSLLKNLSTISESFWELEELVLLSRDRDDVELTLPSTFRWGPRLRTLHSTRIAFPSFPQLLSFSGDLVDLQLHEIPSAGYFSPEEFANALSGMAHLRSLSLHFLCSLPRRYFGLPPQSGVRVILPALTCFKYRGTSKYLDYLVARIDAPHLGDIDITFFSQLTMDASQLGLFIERIEMQTSLNQADVQTSPHAISICFSEPGASTRLELRISCEQLDWQLSSMAQICHQFSPFLSGIEDLGISSTQKPGDNDDKYDEQWLELICAFGGVKEFRVAGAHVTDILCALRPVDGVHTAYTSVLPALRNLRFQEPMPMVGPLWDAAQSYITSRRLSGRPIESVVRQYCCHLCGIRFAQSQTLRRHLADKHMPRRVCPLCGDFKWSQGRTHLLRKHLAMKHPEVAHTDPLISHSDDLGTRDDDLHTTVTSESSTPVTGPHDSWHKIPTADGLPPWFDT